jgi:hypothetical protein
MRLKKDLAHKETEIEQAKSASCLVEKKVDFMPENRRTYNERDFQEAIKPLSDKNEPSYTFDSEFARNLLEESEDLKRKLANAYKEIQINQHEFDLRLKQMAGSYDKTVNELKEKHRYEVDKLLRLFMINRNGSIEDPAIESEFLRFNDQKNLSSGMSSVLDDPAYIRLLLKASDNFQNRKLESLMETNRILNENLAEFKMYRENCKLLEEANSGLKRRVNELESELSRLKSSSGSFSTLKEIEMLNEKLRAMEERYARREREIDDIVNGRVPSNHPIRRSTENLMLNLSDDAKTKNLVSYYENQLRIKNKEIEKFRLELDAMLKLLQSLRN